MLGIADSRSGLTVLDLRQEDKDGGYHVLYHVPVEEIRNFQLVGDFVGVFHKFEPNVSFWNMMEQKTILCINIQVRVAFIHLKYCSTISKMNQSIPFEVSYFSQLYEKRELFCICRHFKLFMFYFLIVFIFLLILFLDVR